MLRIAADVPASLRAFLVLDHHRLEQVFAALLESFGVPDTGQLRRSWARFEVALAGHLDAEERYMLPLFGLDHPAEAEALRAEHARFRDALDALGIGVDLHLVKLELARDFVAALQHHAAREERLLYAWAERELDPSAKRRIRDAVWRAGVGL